MSDKINENDALSRLLTLAGIQPTILVVQPKAEEDVAEEDEVTLDATTEPNEQDIDIDALTPTKKAQRKLRFVPARHGDNPIEETLEEKEQRLAQEYLDFKSE